MISRNEHTQIRVTVLAMAMELNSALPFDPLTTLTTARMMQEIARIENSWALQPMLRVKCFERYFRIRRRVRVCECVCVRLRLLMAEEANVQDVNVAAHFLPSSCVTYRIVLYHIESQSLSFVSTNLIYNVTLDEVGRFDNVRTPAFEAADVGRVAEDINEQGVGVNSSASGPVRLESALIREAESLLMHHVPQLDAPVRIFVLHPFVLFELRSSNALSSSAHALQVEVSTARDGEFYAAVVRSIASM